MRKSILYSTATLIASLPLVLVAQPIDLQVCGISNSNDFLSIDNHSMNGSIDITADDVTLIEKGASIFNGDVLILYNGKELTAEKAIYNRDIGDIHAQDNVKIRDSEAILTAQHAQWSLTNNIGHLVGAHYRFKLNHSRGQANKLEHFNDIATELEGATYTTCDVDDNAWLLKSENVSLDHQSAVGTARNVTVELAGIPVFYTPYLSFPLNNERKSGFLVPSIGMSDETGFDLTTPYYWNIAPNQDMTMSPRYMSDRGMMLTGEYRYLFEQINGVIDAGYLASDLLKNNAMNDNPYYQKKRAHFSLKSESRLLDNWHANVDYNYASDDRYFEDFSPSLSLASTTHLNRLLNVGYLADNWRFTGRLQGYQVLSDINAPYQKLPQLTFSGVLPQQPWGLNFGWSAEYVDFSHQSQVSGQRIDLSPSMSLPMRSTYSFITPRVALQHTQYSLDSTVSASENSSITRTLPVASIDSGLFFERHINIDQSNYIHTLEPRGFYLYIPERNQSDIPVFDTGLRTFNMTQLFSYDRFSGVDRVGDSNQLSLALTSRLLDTQTGQEKLRVSVGQIHYFSDRKVQLNTTNPVETKSTSDMIAEIAAYITHQWTVRGEIQWSPDNMTSSLSSLQLGYKSQNGSLLNVGHRYRREGAYLNNVGVEQIDISAQLPLTEQWSVVGRWYRSLYDSQTLETLAGVQYESCCWASRVVLRDYVNDVSSENSNLSLFFQIELKGLGNFGQNTDALLERSILGYGS